MKFKHEQLPIIYEGVRIGNATQGVCYVFSNEKGDFMEVYVIQTDKDLQWRFVVDNYPRQRKFYSTNLPYRTIEEFEYDIDRIGIEKLKRKKDVCPVCNFINMGLMGDLCGYDECPLKKEKCQ